MRWALFLLMLVGSGCNTELPLPPVTGKQGELVVVCPKQLWDGSVGDTLFAQFTTDVYGLPQGEPMFRTVYIDPQGFSNIFRTHRNLLILQHRPGQKPHIEVRRDVFAKPQIVVEAFYDTDESLLRLMSVGDGRITKHLLDAEMERVQISYAAQLEKLLMEPLAEQRIKLTMPTGYKLVKKEPDMCWLRYDGPEVNQSLFVFSEPYTRPDSFKATGLTAVIDSMAAIQIPGPDSGTYVTIYREYPVQVTDTDIDGHYATRMVGLWRVEGDIMGGPFVHYALLDEERHRVLHLFGLVFAPGEDKRNLVLQMEAIIRSLEWL